MKKLLIVFGFLFSTFLFAAEGDSAMGENSDGQDGVDCTDIMNNNREHGKDADDQGNAGDEGESSAEDKG